MGGCPFLPGSLVPKSTAIIALSVFVCVGIHCFDEEVFVCVFVLGGGGGFV